MKDCLLPRLKDLALGGLPGLKVDSLGFLQIDNRALVCCAGTGGRLSLDGTTTLSCDLSARLKVARAIAHQLERTVPPGHEPALPHELKRGAGPAPVFKRLAAIANKESGKGLAGQNDTLESGPSVWAMAIAAAWRFGLTPHVVVVGRTPPAKILPSLIGQAPNILFVGSVDRLWEAPEADAMEALISYAYGSMTPLFIEFVTRRGPTTMSATKALRHGHVGTAFSKKLRDISARPPLSWLAPASLSKLQGVTDGLQDAIAAADRYRGKKKAPKVAQVPSLPWD